MSTSPPTPASSAALLFFAPFPRNLFAAPSFFVFLLPETYLTQTLPPPTRRVVNDTAEQTSRANKRASKQANKRASKRAGEQAGRQGSAVQCSEA